MGQSMGFLKIPDRNESQTQSKEPEKCIDFALPMNPKREFEKNLKVFANLFEHSLGKKKFYPKTS